MRNLTVNKPVEIPATFKKTSRYIKNIEDYSGIMQSHVINALADTDVFWKSTKADPSLVPQRLLQEGSISETIKKYQKENKECINIVRKKIGAKTFDVYLNKKSSLNAKAARNHQKDLQRIENYKKNGVYEDESKTTFKLFLFFTFIICYFLWAIFLNNGEDCENITYQDFDANYNIVEKKGIVCGPAKDKTHSRWKDD